MPGPVRSLPLKTLRVDPVRSKVMGSSYSSTRPSVNVIWKRVLLATGGVWHESRHPRSAGRGLPRVTLNCLESPTDTTPKRSQQRRRSASPARRCATAAGGWPGLPRLARPCGVVARRYVPPPRLRPGLRTAAASTVQPGTGPPTGCAAIWRSAARSSPRGLSPMRPQQASASARSARRASI